MAGSAGGHDLGVWNRQQLLEGGCLGPRRYPCPHHLLIVSSACRIWCTTGSTASTGRSRCSSQLLCCAQWPAVVLVPGGLTGHAPIVQEAKLNSFASFMMEVNGINLHFVHERSQHADAIPLLLLHGWPGSFWEFHRLIPMLTRPGVWSPCLAHSPS